MARTVRKSGVKEVPLSEIKDDLSRYLREAETQEIIITRHGKPAGVLIGFESEEDWFDYRLEHDPRFLRALNRRGTACALEAESDWRTSKRSRRSHRRSVPALLLRTKIVLQSTGVEFIDENGGGPGVRLRKPLNFQNEANFLTTSIAWSLNTSEFIDENGGGPGVRLGSR